MASDEAIYGLFGRKLSHSFSSKYFSQKFVSESIDAHYWNFESASPESIVELPVIFPALKGLNVTLPYKEAIIPYLDELSSEAREIGAVNTVKIIRLQDERPFLKGFNTDCLGFAATVTPPQIKKVMILGTGGAAKAVKEAVIRRGGECLMVSRNPVGKNMISYDGISSALLKTCTMIVNATPLGMWPNVGSCPPIPYDELHSSMLCYDLTYNPEITTFMQRSAKAGAETKNGLEMLHNQAEAAWHIWNAPE